MRTSSWRRSPFGKLTNSIRVVSNGTAVEETIGTPADKETSLYTRDGRRLLLTHYCALTPQGHIARLATQPLQGAPVRLEFKFVAATNLPRPDAAHMRRVLITLSDHDHFSEQWTKSENGKDTVFELQTFQARGTCYQWDPGNRQMNSNSTLPTAGVPVALLSWNQV